MVDPDFVNLARGFSVGEPKIYTPENIDSGVLPVFLAGKEFSLPIKGEGGVKFAWLDPSGADAELQQACAIEIGIRLARRTGNAPGVVILPPSGKSTRMAEMAGQIASGLTGREMLIVKAGGGLMREKEQLLPGSSFELSDIKIGGITAPVRARADFGEKAWVVRYMPITGKDKFMYLTATQWTQMQIAFHSGGVLVTCEDVVTTGTTIEAMRRLMAAAGISEPMEVIAVAREGESYTGQMEFAIQIPVL